MFSVQGKAQKGEPSRLCKHNMFKLFNQLKSKIPNNIEGKRKGMTYADYKGAAVGYQEVKTRILSCFVKAQLGSWIKKPMELDQFN